MLLWLNIWTPRYITLNLLRRGDDVISTDYVGFAPCREKARVTFTRGDNDVH
jgi:hypothetical protein